MNSQPQQRNFADILILLLLPAPVTGIALVLLSVYAIASGTNFNFIDNDKPAEAVIEPTSTISAEAALIATVSAAPVRELAPDPAVAAAYDPALVDRGRSNYLAICTACHGTDAKGISGLGKTLLGSEFVRSQDDQSLLQFVITGRNIWDPGNTTGVAMPARGGNPGLTDSDILSIIAYIRTLDGFLPGQTASDTTVAATIQPTATTEITEADLAFTPFMVIEGDAMGNAATPEPSTDRDGATVYNVLCGISYGGLTICDYLQDELAAGTSEDDLFNTMVTGLSSFAAGNTSGVNIPPRGGAFPPLTDGEIRNLIEHIKTLE